MIDVRKMLYHHRKNEIRFQNIEHSLCKIKKEYPSTVQRYNDDIQGMGGYVYSQTERFGIYNVLEIETRRDKLEQQLKYTEQAINLVLKALGTLNHIQRDLIDARYFQDRKPSEVARMINVSEDHYWKLHRIAFGGIEECLNEGEMEVDNPFIPMKTTKKTTIKMTNTLAKMMVN